ncbi:hypothetical protein GQX73_g1409 [Xylaria multiplex]|uniref:Nudix hydrolase domain-containing protein n=1 Tax=Xylaria multiplex TaxID=323545 RepID=A0A7C8MZ53_9PEZI|nr:hypothetical protein GQX73_g1409 [Xylaria multiplex]
MGQLRSLWRLSGGPPQPESHHNQQKLERKRNDSKFGLNSGFRNTYPTDRTQGHLRLSTMRSALLPSQKAILAMSGARFLAYLRSSSADGARPMSVLNYTGDKATINYEPFAYNTRGGKSPLGAADKLSVGVCIFRLDEETLRPTVLLLRRSPRWWRRRVFASTGGRQGAGEWELPGGKISDDDFCVSAAIGRLVREKTGLRVTKIMAMLSAVRWRAELKVLRWEEDQRGAAYLDSTEEEDEDGDGDSWDDDYARKVDSGVNIDWSSIITTTTTTTTTMGEEVIGGTVNTEDGENGGKAGILPLSDANVLGISVSKSPSSPRSSPVLITPDSASVSPPPPPPPPKDDVYDDGDAYQYIHHDDYGYLYNYDPDHDPSLEPAPLSLPSRSAAPETTAGGEARQTLRRRNTASSTTLPLPLPSFYDGDAQGSGKGKGKGKADGKRRDALVIPYRIVRKEHAQLNFVVLVDEDGADEGLPGFLDGGGKRGEVCEHDALEWATCARVEALPMGEDLRRVVLEGLEWIGGLTGDFF